MGHLSLFDWFCVAIVLGAGVFMIAKMLEYAFDTYFDDEDNDNWPMGGGRYCC